MRLVDSDRFRLADILSALSCALDMVEGQSSGHAVRTCILAVEIGRRLGLSESELADLYFAALMKDAGCSANSVRIHAIFGDDHAAKHAVKLIDWTRKFDCLKFGIRQTYPGAPILTRLAKMVRAVGDRDASMDSLTAARCSRGAQIALQLGFGVQVAEAIRSLDEHWDGLGAPSHLAGDAIPLFSRILCLCQTLDVLIVCLGLPAAFKIVRGRKGTWFDPAVCEVALQLEWAQNFWSWLDSDARDFALALRSPAVVREASEATVDQVCDAFASVIDAKSSFTSEHSKRVMLYSVELGRMLDFSPERLQQLRRAALLHDIGKLGVPTAILDKPGRLDDQEFQRVREHPAHTERILGMIQGFDRVKEIAAAHHERLDGSGYHRGLFAEQLDLDMRIVAAADVFDALSARRPYRDALELTDVFRILENDAGSGLDSELVGLLRERYLSTSGPTALAA